MKKSVNSLPADAPAAVHHSAPPERSHRKSGNAAARPGKEGSRDFMEDCDDDFFGFDQAKAEQMAPPRSRAKRKEQSVFADEPVPAPAAAANLPPRSGKSRAIGLWVVAALMLASLIAGIRYLTAEEPYRPQTVPSTPVTARPVQLPAPQAPAPPRAVLPPPAKKSASPGPTAARAVAKVKPAPPRAAPPPRSRSAVASKAAAPERPRRTRPRPQAPRFVTRHVGSASTIEAVACILPSGQEVRMAKSACRARSGVIYQ